MGGRGRGTCLGVRHLTAVVLLALGGSHRLEVKREPPPIAETNDNRHAAGTVRGDTLFLDLDVRLARWYPEPPGGTFVKVPVLGVVARVPQVPGPLIRVREGTTIVARLPRGLGSYRLIAGEPGKPSWEQRLVVR